MFRADGQTGMTKLIDSFQNFTKAPTNEGDKEKFVSLDTVKACGRVEIQLHSFLTSALGRGVGQSHALASSSRRTNPGTH